MYWCFGSMPSKHKHAPCSNCTHSVTVSYALAVFFAPPFPTEISSSVPIWNASSPMATVGTYCAAATVLIHTQAGVNNALWTATLDEYNQSCCRAWSCVLPILLDLILHVYCVYIPVVKKVWIAWILYHCTVGYISWQWANWIIVGHAQRFHDENISCVTAGGIKHFWMISLYSAIFTFILQRCPWWYSKLIFTTPSELSDLMLV